jgi:signal transduction histidine kinase
MKGAHLIGLAIVTTVAAALDHTPTRWEALGIVAAAIGITLWNRSPVAAMLLASGATVVASSDGRLPIVVLLALVASMAAAAYKTDHRKTILLLAVGIISLCAAVALDDQVNASAGTQSILLLAAVAFAAWGIKRSVTRRIELEHLQSSLGLAKARSELARDVHDVTSHALMAVLTQLRVGRRGIDSGDSLAAGRGIDQAEAAARAAIGDLRALTLLVSGGDAPLATCRSLREIYDQIAQACANFPSTEFHHDETDAPVESNVATTAIRVIQQCLANAAAHAPGSYLTVTSTVRSTTSGPWLRLVTRNRSSASSEHGLQLGLSIMAQRVAEVGGTLSAGHHENMFRVECSLPIGGAL